MEDSDVKYPFNRYGMKNRVIKNIFSSWGMFAVIFVIGFFLTPLFVHKLGDYEYGIWILLLSIIGYMELFSLGFNKANVRYLSKYFGLKDHKTINEIFNCGLFIFMSLGVIVIIVTLSISPFLWRLLYSSPLVLSARHSNYPKQL